MATAPFEIYVKLDGIEGESTVRGHENETIVLSYEQSIDHPAPPLTGSTGVAPGRPTFSGVRFRKPLDKGSIPLLLACAASTVIRSARFAFRRTGTGLDFYLVTLADVQVRHIVQRAGAGAQYPLSFDTLTSGIDTTGFLDEVTLSYSRIQWEYHPVTATGAPGPVVTGGWDLRLNQKI